MICALHGKDLNIFTRFKGERSTVNTTFTFIALVGVSMVISSLNKIQLQRNSVHQMIYFKRTFAWINTNKIRLIAPRKIQIRRE